MIGVRQRFIYAGGAERVQDTGPRYYNTDRAHTGRWTRRRTPESVIGRAAI